MPRTSSARCRADSGVVSDGLSITLFPATSGAASAFTANMMGWLKGKMRATTPIGSRTEKCDPRAEGMEWPFISRARPA
jgi:hypothetical protein